MAIVAFRSPQQFVVKGKVTDAATGSPLAGVTVSVKGTKTSTITGTDGKFTITVNKENATLVFSQVGYDNIEMKAASTGQEMIINLKIDSTSLDEVVVTGYGTQRKKEITGSVSVINGKKVRSSHDDKLSRQLSGSSPGIYAGEPRREIRRKDKPDTDPWRNNNNYEREGYDGIVENRFLKATDNPLSTFSIDVDAASYSNIRRMLNAGNLPPAGAVRIEEMINYFQYDYAQPENNDPFSINTEISECPWNTKHKLVVIGLQGKKIPTENLPSANIVFLVDVSGSMMDENKLPLVKQSLKLLADQIRNEDKVAIVVYAGNAGLVLPSVSGEEKTKIKDAIDQLEAGGSTAGGAGIQLAYKVAKDNFIKNGNNRVVLCTDGDFNVGTSSDAALEQMIEEERKSGVFLTVLGYGTGNYQDAKMQKLADKGNGNHAYIDNFQEARKVLVNEFGGTLFTIAKDVKLQIEFNPHKVQAYRLVGYENRMLNKEDFNNDLKDAGELGSGHTVTALYEIIPIGVKSDFIESVDQLKYQKEMPTTVPSGTNEIMTIKFRYKKPDELKSKLIEHAVIDREISVQRTSDNFRFAAAVAQFGMLLRRSEFKQSSSYENSWKLAKSSLGDDKEGYRSEFLKMIKNAESIATKSSPSGQEINTRK
ncbi:MAG: von Willebrand factor type A domain-containing protein [Chitinophagaceae bacterium]|nr:von Willebrand factor type A domain-containing protein [Chitinophagaceae bacterium]